MRLIAEDLTVYEVEGVVARWKDQSARSGHGQGLKHGFIASAMVLGLLTALGWTAGVVSFHSRPVRPTEPGLPGTVPIGAPAPLTGVVPPLPAPASAPCGKLPSGSVAPPADKGKPDNAKPPTKFLLPAPPNSGGWVRGLCGGWACHVEQHRYGHVAKKATWLYAFGTELPSLRWGHVADANCTALVSWCGNNTKANEARPRVGKAAAAATPPAFGEELLAMAKSVRVNMRDGVPRKDAWNELPKPLRAATPPQFGDLLLSIARSAGR